MGETGECSKKESRAGSFRVLGELWSEKVAREGAYEEVHLGEPQLESWRKARGRGDSQCKARCGGAWWLILRTPRWPGWIKPR